MASLATVLTPAVIQLIIQEAPALIADIEALFAKHPTLTPDVLGALVAATHTVNADTAATIAADQAAHPTG